MRAGWLVGLVTLGAAVALVLWSGETAADDVAPRSERRDEPQDIPAFTAPHEAEAPQAVEAVASAPAAASLAAEDVSSLELVIRHADGVPAARCRVALVTGAEVAWSAFAGDDGVAHGVRIEGAAVAWVAGATLLPAQFPLADGHGRHELVLPAGEIIEGRVEFEGGPPPEPVPLGLAPIDVDSVPWTVRRALFPNVMGFATPSLDDSLGSLLGDGGSFRFSGLTAGWEGRFEVPYTYFADGEHDLDARAPEHGRVLKLHRVPHVRFRVVSPGERSPVPFATATAMVSGNNNSSSTSMRCDAEGRADVAMQRWGQTLAVWIEASNPEGTARTTQKFELKDSSKDVDLGDIELVARWTVPFRVTELDGTPIAGAVAETNCGDRLRSEPTTADGSGQLVGVPPGCAEILVAAARHALAHVPLPAALPAQPIEVKLARSNWLTLHVASAADSPLTGLRLQMQSPQRMSKGEAAIDFLADALQLGLKVGNGSMSFGREDRTQADGTVLRTWRHGWRLRGAGEFELGSVEPGLPVELQILDCARGPVWAASVVLGPTEERRLEAVIASKPATVELLVEDETGAPVPDVEVSLRASQGAVKDVTGGWSTLRTDAAGRVQIADVYTPLVDVSCKKEGFMPATLAGVVPGVLGHVTLRRGLVVTLRCVDARGAPSPVQSVWCKAPKGADVDHDNSVLDEDGRITGSATWRIQGLPPGPMQIEVSAGGRRFQLEHDASEPEARFVVPDHGAVLVRGLQSAKDRNGVRLNLALEGADDTSPGASIGLGAISRDRVTVPLVFPGRYRVELTATDETGTHTLAGPVHVDVRVGETSEVSLD